jgi:hypothetical protein
LIFNAREAMGKNQRIPDSILIRKKGPEISRQPARMAGLLQNLFVPGTILKIYQRIYP